MTPHAVLIATGDELVRGLTADTNGGWIASRLAAIGVRVARLVVLPDDPEAVASEIRTALADGASLVVTTGGLGPTADDRTLEAVARATGRPLVEDADAVGLVRGRYADLVDAGLLTSPDLTPERRKMAHLPTDASPLPNAVGTAPGAAVESGEALVLSLPGVPKEMEAMWEGPVSELLRDRFGASGYAEVTVRTDCNDESVLAPVVAAAGERHADAYVKSRAANFSGGLRVTIVAGGTTDDDAARALDDVLADLRDALADLGHGIAERA